MMPIGWKLKETGQADRRFNSSLSETIDEMRRLPLNKNMKKKDSNLPKKMKSDTNCKKWQNYSIILATIRDFATMLLKQSGFYLS